MTKPKTDDIAILGLPADVAAGISAVTTAADALIEAELPSALAALRAKLQAKGKVPFAGKEARKSPGKLPVPPPKAQESVVPTGLVGNLEPPVKPPTLPVNEWTPDPKKEGIPMALQTQNRRPLTPEEKAALAAAKPTKEVKVGGTKKPAAKKATAKKPAPAKVDKPGKPASKKPASSSRGGSKVDLIAGMFKRKTGCTTAEVLEATGWTAVNMPRQAKQAGLKIKKVMDGKVTRYIAI